MRCDSQVYMIGGYTIPGERVLASVEVFNPRTRVWTSAEPMPTARYAARVSSRAVPFVLAPPVGTT